MCLAVCTSHLYSSSKWKGVFFTRVCMIITSLDYQERIKILQSTLVPSRIARRRSFKFLTSFFRCSLPAIALILAALSSTPWSLPSACHFACQVSILPSSPRVLADRNLFIWYSASSSRLPNPNSLRVSTSSRLRSFFPLRSLPQPSLFILCLPLAIAPRSRAPDDVVSSPGLDHRARSDATDSSLSTGE